MHVGCTSAKWIGSEQTSTDLDSIQEKQNTVQKPPKVTSFSYEILNLLKKWFRMIYRSFNLVELPFLLDLPY